MNNNNMNIIRPITQADYSALYEIANESGIGFTSLPVNDALLKNKIQKAETTFNPTDVNPGSYLFVLQDPAGNVLGTSGIEAYVGLDDPFYHYHISKVVHASRELKVHNTVELLTFCNDYTGVSEICTLFLRESARHGPNGRFLSKFRFLFIAEHSENFSNIIIAEMRGVSDEAGVSPFWEWLETNFFSMDFPTADYLTGIGKKVFIAELMPKYPIYINLLSQDAQKVIGKVHEKTQPALKLLQQEGFVNRGYVDIFDAGPTVEADLQHIRSAQQSRKLAIEIDDNKADKGAMHYIINTSIKNFRAVTNQLCVCETHQLAFVSQGTAKALKVKQGDMVRFSPEAYFEKG